MRLHGISNTTPGDDIDRNNPLIMYRCRDINFQNATWCSSLIIIIRISNYLLFRLFWREYPYRVDGPIPSIGHHYAKTQTLEERQLLCQALPPWFVSFLGIPQALGFVC